jgi:phosphoribosylformylglycinamidine synthase
MTEDAPLRFEVASRHGFADGRALRLLPGLQREVSPLIRDIRIIDVYIVHGAPGLRVQHAREVLADAVSQEVSVRAPAGAPARAREGAPGGAPGEAPPDWDYLVEVTVKPGVTDPVGQTARQALIAFLPEEVPAEARVQTATQYLILVGDSSARLDRAQLASFFYNPLIQSALIITCPEWQSGSRPPVVYPQVVSASSPDVEILDLAGLGDEELVALSRSRLLALSLAEMKAVQGYFSRQEVRDRRRTHGLPAAATDVELEMIAQTWSEHCKHKIFNATIHYRESYRESAERENSNREDAARENSGEQVIRSLFRTYIRATTESMRRKRRFLRSVFHDNSGVIEFDRSTLICFKVETHNSPSALDPYGGAITGIVGVNRDIIGTGMGARPLFNTDVLCFGFPRTPPSQVPAGLMHPRRVMEGVHRGIVDGGNQSGIPVVAGAFLFDDSFLGKPLVFCGTGGVLPARVRGRPGWRKSILPGDLAVMVGGRVGKDGIHGATFSSEALSESSPTSAVQIGDPITQKKMLDMILEARDLGLYRGITDNGAGGLSSSLGEMASLSGGVRIDLDACPLKYTGLAPWEILVSESQERMSLAVPKERVAELLALAARRDVEATVVGEFTSTRTVDVRAGGKRVGLLDLDFLHDGLPVMDLRAEWTPAAVQTEELPPDSELGRMLLSLLADPNICSRETWVRQFDHEVQGRSVVKPFVGRRRDAPSDGGVLRVRPGSRRGITVTHGICPWYGDEDTYEMARCAVDEAVRAHIALGGDPDRMSALDNFCWPDPVESPETPDGKRKLAQLVRACQGLADACQGFQLPLISGKDSMKNDAHAAGRKISIRPTLLVSLMGIIRDVRKAVTTDFKQPGDLIYVVGETRGELGGTSFERLAGRKLGPSPRLQLDQARACYERLSRAIARGLVRSCHDLSDGGLWVALAESSFGGDCGARISLDGLPVSGECGREPARLLFCETPSRFLVSVGQAARGPWERAMTGTACALMGEVTPDDALRVLAEGSELCAVPLREARIAWQGEPGARA